MNKLTLGGPETPSPDHDTLKNARYISPTRMEKYGSVPDALAREFLGREYGADVTRIGQTVEGIEVHDAFDRAFKHISFAQEKYRQSGTNPSAAAIKDIIGQSMRKAQGALKLHASQQQAGFVKSAVEHFGTKALQDLDIRVLSEHEVKTSGNKLHPRLEFAGRLDLLFYNERTKEAEIFDWKSYGDREFTRSTEADYLRRKWQTKGYIYAVGEELSTEQVKMTYVFNGKAYGKNNSFHAVTVDGLDPTKLGRASNEMKAELQTMFARIESARMIAYEKTREGGQGALKEHILSLVGNPRFCNAGSCGTCVFKLQCNRSALIMDEARKGFSGETVQTKIDSFEKTLDPDRTPGAVEKRYLETAREERRAFRKRRALELYRDGVRGTGLRNRLNEEVSLLEESQKTRQYLSRGQYQDALSKGAVSADTRLLYSTLTDGAQAPWMSGRLARHLKDQTVDRISSVLGSLETKVPSGVIEKDVLDRVFRDESFMGDLSKRLYRKAGETLREEGMKLNRRNVREALGAIGKIFTKDEALLLEQKIDQEVVRSIIHLDEDAITRRTGPELVKGRNIAAITQGLVETGAIRRNPEVLARGIAKTGTVAGALAKGRMGLPKFPLPAVIAAGMLSYIAGKIGAHNQVTRKIEKATEFSIMFDDTVEAAPHTSAETSARRILTSDFASPVRPGAFSGIVASLKGRGSAFPRKLKDMMTRGQAELRSTGTLRDFFKGFKREGGIGTDPAVIFGGAALGAFAVMGFLTHVKTDREIGEDARSRKRRFKRMKQENWNTISPSPEPESDIRRASLQHTPFGSFVDTGATLYSAAFRAFRYLRPSEIVEKVGEWLSPSRVRDMKDSVTGATTHLLQNFSMDKAKRVGELAVKDPGGVVKRAAGRAASSVRAVESAAHEMASNVKRRAGQSSTLREGRKLADRPELRKALRAGESALMLNDTRNLVTGNYSASLMPVIEKQPRRHDRTIVTTQRERQAPSYERGGEYNERRSAERDMVVLDRFERPVHAVTENQFMRTLGHEYEKVPYTRSDTGFVNSEEVIAHARQVQQVPSVQTRQLEPQDRSARAVFPKARPKEVASDAVNRIAMNRANWNRTPYGRQFGTSSPVLSPYDTLFEI